MNKYFTIMAIILFEMVSHAQITYTATFTANALSLSTTSAPDGNTYTKVSLTGAEGHVCEAGEPKLPTHTLRLMIPFNMAVTSITCSNVVTQNYQISNRVYPVESYDSITPIFTAPKTAIYNSNSVYPLQSVTAWGQGYMDGNNNIVSVEVCPFQYYPSRGQLKLITSMTITVNYSSGFIGGIQNINRLQHTQNLCDSVLYNTVNNPQVIPYYRINPNIVTELENTGTGLPVYEYVVIVPNFYENHQDLKRFVDWKRQKGYHAGIVTVEDIIQAYPNGDMIGTYPIADDAGSLRQYLHDAYQLGTFYAFFVGDPNVSPNTHRYIPFRYGSVVNNVNPDSYWYNRPTTDWYYSDLVGDWNKDNDIDYGEPHDDSPSRFPNIYVGRLLCSSSEELSNWINKLLLYEKNPGNGNASYVTESIVTRADNVADGGFDSYIGTLSRFHHTVLQELPSMTHPCPTFPKGSDVINNLNSNSYGLMTWFNHGGTNHKHSCMVPMMSGSVPHNTLNIWKLYADANCVDEGLNVQPDTNNSLDCLTNYNTPFVIYAVSCKVNPFDHTKSNSLNNARNCGESFTVGGSYGGVAFMGNTVDASGSYYTCFANVLDNAYNNPINSHLGILETQPKLLSNLWPSYYYKHNLIGDPECQIWTKTPTAMNVNVYSSGMINYVQGVVRVEMVDLQVGEQATVTLYSEDDIFQIREITIGSNHCVEFDSVFPVTTNPIVVTVTSYNHIPYQTWIPVTKECQIVVSTNETWENNNNIMCDIIVKRNATLTLKGNVGMNTSCKIVVEAGGKLVVDGGKLFCLVLGHQWQGIRVHGTGGTGYQGLTLGQYQQGFVSLKNNAQICDARVAVDLWDGIHLSTTGGIVHAKDVSFSNNAMAVRALHFKNELYNPNYQGYSYLDYNARFENCDFSIDDDYPAFGEIFRHHVELAKVSGVRFHGCNFHIQDCPLGLCSDDNAAIYSFDAGFKIDRYCGNNMAPCPTNSYINTHVQGFNIGVNAVGSNSNSSITIQNAVFNDNVFGIRTLNNVNLTVLFSDFVIGGNGTCCVGVYLDRTSMFCIEENSFTKSVNATNGVDCFGIAAFFTNSANDVYRNTFSNLTCANFADGNNLLSGQTGLTYSCNDNSGNLIDFCVPIHNAFGTINNIQSFQGSYSKAAGNTFSQSGVQWQFHNGGDDVVTYYYNPYNPLEEPQNANIYKIRRFAANGSNECLSHYPDEGDTPILSEEKRRQRENDYYSAYSNYGSLRNLYTNYLDGGNTSDELRDIYTATTSDMWELRAQLLGHSPYLSNEVLRATMNRDDIFTESILFEILAANPEELGRDTLLEYIENNKKLPEYMLGVLRGIANSTNSPRSVLESEMAYYKQEYCLAAKDIIRSIQNDSIKESSSELRTWLSHLEDIDADRQIIASYMQDGDNETAFALANMLPSLYGLTGDALFEHDGYMKLLALDNALDKQGRTVFELTENEMNLVDSLFVYGIGIAQSMAKGMMEANRDVTFIYCPEIELFERGRSIEPPSFTPDEINKAWGLSVGIKPNPATTWTAVDFTLPNKDSKANLTITNALGVVVQNVDLNGNSGQRVLDLRNLANGLYIITVKCGELSQTEKLIIAK